MRNYSRKLDAQGWKGWTFSGGVLVSPTGETFARTDLEAVYLAWQMVSALKQERARLADQLAAARAIAPRCPRSWHRQRHRAPPQLDLFRPQKSPA